MKYSILMAFALALLSGLALAQDTEKDTEQETDLEQLTVEGQPWRFNETTRYAHTLPEVDDTKLTVTKKTSIVDLDRLPTLATGNARELLATLPGLQQAEQQAPTQINLNYRGLGNPQESEYVLVMQDDVPLMSDWIGFPTLFVVPQPQSLERVELYRAGASLLYGPEPAPTINYVSRFPKAGAPLSGVTEHVVGSDAGYSTYNALSGSNGSFSGRGDFGYRRSDGERENGDYNVRNSNLLLGYQIDSRQNIRLDLHGYSTDSGLPGFLSYAQFNNDPDTTTTPNDREWVRRYWATLSHEFSFDNDALLTSQIWSGSHQQTSRTVADMGSTIDQQEFKFTGVDVRYKQPWGNASAWTIGATGYHSTSPFRRAENNHVNAGRNDLSGHRVIDQMRGTDYFAAFGELLWRLESFHMVFSARVEHQKLDIDERQHPPFVMRDNIQRDFSRTVPLFGFGIGNDFGHGNETYFNVSQGYRPLRYFDVASPFQSLTADNDPNPPESLTYEAGVHGWPSKGLYYDVSLFYINFQNRIEAQPAPGGGPRDTINVNTGDTRHQGLEFEGEYDLLSRLAETGQKQLSLFANLQLLDAEFTASANAGQIGKTPAYAPKVIGRTGLIYRDSDRLSASLSVNIVGRQYWRDNNTSAGDIPAEIPSYTVVDFSADWRVLPHLKLLAGVSNIGDHRYYSRILPFGEPGIDPAPGRKFYAGVSADF